MGLQGGEVRAALSGTVRHVPTRPTPWELARGSFYLRTTAVGNDRLLVNTTHFYRTDAYA